MARVKGGNVARKRRKKVLKLAKGYFGSKHLLYKTAHEQVMNSLMYAYRDRKKRKSNFRKLWISRINAATRENGMSYSQFMNGLKKSNVVLNRKVLAELAISDSAAFKRLVETAKEGIANPKKVEEKPLKIAQKQGKNPFKKEVAPKKEAAPKKETAPKKEAAPKKEGAPKKEVAPKTVDYKSMTVSDLKALCKEKGLEGYSALKKAELIALLEN